MSRLEIELGRMCWFYQWISHYGDVLTVSFVKVPKFLHTKYSSLMQQNTQLPRFISLFLVSRKHLCNLRELFMIYYWFIIILIVFAFIVKSSLCRCVLLLEHWDFWFRGFGFLFRSVLQFWLILLWFWMLDFWVW